MTIPIAEAAAELGMTRPDAARWLRRYLKRRGEVLEQELLVDVGSKGSRRPTYHVSLAHLRIWCPELFDPGDSLAKAVRALERRIDRVDERLEELQLGQTVQIEALRRIRRSYQVGSK